MNATRNKQMKKHHGKQSRKKHLNQKRYKIRKSAKNKQSTNLLFKTVKLYEKQKFANRTYKYIG